MNLGPYERNCRAHWATHNDPMPEDFSFQALPRRSGAAGMVSQRRHRARADPRHGRPLQGDQRADPLCAGWQPADRADARRAERLRGLRLHLRHRAGGGAGKVLAEWVTEGQTGMGHVVLRPAPLHRLRRRAGPCRRQGHGNLRQRIRDQFPRHAWPAARGRKLSPIHDRIAALGAEFNAYNGWERATWYAKPGDDTSEESTLTFRRDGPGKSAYARNAWRCAMPPASSTCPVSRASACMGRGARAWLSTDDHRHRAETRQDRPRLLRRRQGPHRHRNVDHGDRRGLLRAGHRCGRASCTTSSGSGSICRKAMELTLEDATEQLTCQILSGPNVAEDTRRSSAAPICPCPGCRTSRPRSPEAGASSSASPSPENLAGKSTATSATRRRYSMRCGPPARSTG